MLQEGTYTSSVYGSLSNREIDAKWSIPKNISGNFPPTFVAHAQNDRFVPHSESEKLVKAFREKGVHYEWWSVPGNHDHGFDCWDMDAGENTAFEMEFALKLWPWLGGVLKL
jgi:acetyl esterase/lipase